VLTGQSGDVVTLTDNHDCQRSQQHPAINGQCSRRQWLFIQDWYALVDPKENQA
jgi:hypothetical protein